MMRLPSFTYRAPKNLAEAARILAEEGSGAMLLGGGTDLLPNMKRRQQTPTTLVALRQIEELRTLRSDDKSGLTLGAGLTLSSLVREGTKHDRGAYKALFEAASQVATPHIQNMGTLGGNLCLDTRCSYYNQNYEWRQAIDFCMKKDGGICWVATSSPKCLAVSSSDTAPALLALSASVRLVSQAGERWLALADLYNNDGIAYLHRRPDEIVASVQLPPLTGWRSTYLKLRRRGSIDFPVLGVAVALRLDGDVVAEARITLGAVASCTLLCEEASASLVGGRLDEARIANAAGLAARLAHPLDNTDLAILVRKRVAREFVTRALTALR